jgi:hypothetical protein
MVNQIQIEGIKICGSEVVTFSQVGHQSLDYFVTDCLKLKTEWLLLNRDTMQATLYPSGLPFTLSAPNPIRLISKDNTIVCYTMTDIRSFNLSLL